MKRSFKDSLHRMFGKRFRAGSYSAFAAMALIAIAVLANLLVGALPTSMTQVDLTSSSIYTLSEQTKRIAMSLDKDVNLYLLATTGGEDDTILRLLDRYAALSSHIKVSSVDPSVQPAFLDSYELNLNTLYANSVLVDCDGRYRLVSYTDIYVTSYSMDYYSYGYSTTTDFNGENALTNAIHYVSSDSLPKVYTLTGHGETALSDDITEMLTQDNLEAETLSLLTLESVPEDASVIVIHAPTSDLGDEETELLIDWMEQGGCLALITDYIETGKMTNLLKVTSAMGVTVENGLVIEGDSTRHLTRYPYYLLPNIEEHDITSALVSGRYYVLLPLAQPIVETEAAATVTPLLTTSDDAYTKAAGMNAATTEREDGDASGPFTVGVAAESGEGRLVWFTSADLLNSSIDRTVSGGNSNLFLNAINWMCGQEEAISIRAKSLDEPSLTVPSAQSTLWSIIMIGVIPLAFIAMGVIVCIRRKRR